MVSDWTILIDAVPVYAVELDRETDIRKIEVKFARRNHFTAVPLNFSRIESADVSGEFVLKPRITSPERETVKTPGDIRLMFVFPLDERLPATAASPFKGFVEMRGVERLVEQRLSVFVFQEISI